MEKNSPEVGEVIEMAWCDKTSFEDIEAILGLREPEVIEIMQKHLKPSSFRMWRARVSGRTAKHKKKSVLDTHSK
jgi:uncharacterized protein (TIGR03643 family)